VDRTQEVAGSSPASSMFISALVAGVRAEHVRRHVATATPRGQSDSRYLRQTTAQHGAAASSRANRRAVRSLPTRTHRTV